MSHVISPKRSFVVVLEQQPSVAFLYRYDRTPKTSALLGTMRSLRGQARI